METILMYNGLVLLNMAHMVIWMHQSYNNIHQKEKQLPETLLKNFKAYIEQWMNHWIVC